MTKLVNFEVWNNGQTIMIWAGNSLIYKRDKGKFQYADI